MQAIFYIYCERKFALQFEIRFTDRSFMINGVWVLKQNQSSGWNGTP